MTAYSSRGREGTRHVIQRPNGTIQGCQTCTFYRKMAADDRIGGLRCVIRFLLYIIRSNSPSGFPHPHNHHVWKACIWYMLIAHHPLPSDMTSPQSIPLGRNFSSCTTANMNPSSSRISLPPILPDSPNSPRNMLLRPIPPTLSSSTTPRT
jgi:hypothetical protein